MDAKITAIDEEKKKISLSIRALLTASAEEPEGGRGPRGGVIFPCLPGGDEDAQRQAPFRGLSFLRKFCDFFHGMDCFSAAGML